VSSRRIYTFAVLVMLTAVAAVSASPTVFSGCPSHPVSVKIDNTSNDSACNLYSGVVDNRIAELAGGFLQPPASSDAGRERQSNNNGTSSAGNIFLPAVPPALFMVLTGFFCVSMVRDRRTWIAIFAGLLWLGQAGFNALPELTSRLSRKIHNSLPVEPKLLAVSPLGGVYYPESYNEQTRYTGLLHHLEGIPCRRNVLSYIKQVALNGCGCAARIGCVDRWSPYIRNRRTIDVTSGATEGRNTQPSASRISHLAFIQVLSLLNTLCDCLVRPIRQFICFTPAFIFSNLSRGPPLPEEKPLFVNLRKCNRETLLWVRIV
jgi:hypothetical protein